MHYQLKLSFDNKSTKGLNGGKYYIYGEDLDQTDLTYK